MSFEESDWYELYAEKWGKLLVDGGMSHPAKFARALIRKIYVHAFEEGFLRPGDTVLDIFSGVGLGALDAMLSGVNWIGVELEQRFVSIANEMECPGVTKELWKRGQGRGRKWDKFGICPTCGEYLNIVLPPLAPGRNQYGLFSNMLRTIPETKPHHFEGNLEAWQRIYGSFEIGEAACIQGDSRFLLDVLGSHAAGVVSSPPYADTPISAQGADGHNQEWNKAYRRYAETGDWKGFQGKMNDAAESAGYTSNPSNLGNLKEGNLDATIGSPPYAEARIGEDGRQEQIGRNVAYGPTDGQLGRLKEGDLDIALSSPPYLNTPVAKNNPGISLEKLYETYKASGAGQTFEQFVATQLKHSQDYGDTEGQLGGLKEGDLAAAISSPPFGAADPRKTADVQARQDGYVADVMNRSYNQDNQGVTPGNLAAMDMSVASPPFLQQSGGKNVTSQEGPLSDAALIARHSAGNKGTGAYGVTDGQMEQMKEGDIDATISSPPYSDIEVASDLTTQAGGRGIEERKARRSEGHWEGYNRQEVTNVANLGGETFWEAAKLIVSQTFSVLRPGGHALWVVKAYVKDGEYIDFPDQWRRLCESVGFETLHWHRAWQVEEDQGQLDFEGNVYVKVTERKSFFRRLQEKKGSPRIDFEVVLCMVKPEG
jgi:hypothetical protein